MYLLSISPNMIQIYLKYILKIRTITVENEIYTKYGPNRHLFEYVWLYLTKLPKFLKYNRNVHEMSRKNMKYT